MSKKITTGVWSLGNWPGSIEMPETKIQNYSSIRLRRVLWCVLAMAVALRIASALYQGNEVEALPGVADQISYHELSLRVLEGHGFSFETGWWPATPAGQPTAHWSYLYVLFLAAVYSLFGCNPIAARLIQAILTGILQPLLTWRIGRRLFGIRIGLFSAAFSSLYAYFIFYSGSLMTEAFYITAMLWIIDIGTSMGGASDRKSDAVDWTRWFYLGLACSAAALLRQVFLFLVPIILLWIAWRVSYRSRLLSMSQLLARSAVPLAILVLCIAPWTIRNYRVFKTFVPLNTNSGFAFFWGNHPIHGTQFIPIMPASKYGSLIPSELRGFNEAEMDKALLRRGLDFVIKDPIRYIRLSLSRAKEYFRIWPTHDSSAASNYARVLSFGLCFPLGIFGLVLLLFSHLKKRSSYRPINPGTSLLLLVGGLYTLLHLMTWTLIRYRLPVDAVWLPFAAVSAAAGYDCFKKGIRILDSQALKTVD
jgi:hypothetical protein